MLTYSMFISPIARCWQSLNIAFYGIKTPVHIIVKQYTTDLDIPNNHLLVLNISSKYFYRATARNATHGIVVAILSVRLSVCLSIRCVYCDKTKQCTVNILIPHEMAITLVFWHQQWLVGDAPFALKFALKVTHPLRKTLTSTDFQS